MSDDPTKLYDGLSGEQLDAALLKEFQAQAADAAALKDRVIELERLVERILLNQHLDDPPWQRPAPE